MAESPMVGVVGLGLIGGSLARALTARGRAIGFDVDPATTDRARAEGVSVAESLDALVPAVDVIVVATPLRELTQVFTEIGRLGQGQGRSLVVTDVGSVKLPVALMAEQLLPPTMPFVGGHPMAGSERSGFDASDPELFEGAPWIVTVDESTDLMAALLVAGVAASVGARAVPVTSADHDRAVAVVSHLPHVIATSLVNTVAAMDSHHVMLRLAAGSFRSATRVADTRAGFTADLTYVNRLPLIDALDSFVDQLVSFREVLNTARVEDDLLPFFGTPLEVRTEIDQHRWVTTELTVDPAEDPAGTRRSLLEIGREGGSITSVVPAGGLFRLRVAVPVA
ncbi:MAG TPA: prephenate dehydrogenase/arogenate dehydrogenase family protein [Acidimicrobiales bacterium]|nr:prephenate dehydrogenase/arogenate dehydrogenase family protein [Acidimicrobiales bacterium]